MSCLITLASCIAAAGVVSLAAAQTTQPMIFVANHHSADVSSYHVHSDGDVLPTPDSPVSPGQDSLILTALTPDGRHLYVVKAFTAGLKGFSLAENGSLTLLLAAWGRCATAASCSADLNSDGFVNGIDLAVLLGQWG